MTWNANRMLDDYPQFGAKQIVDLVTSADVAGEMLRVRAARAGFLRNAAALFTGREARERDVIERALLEGQVNMFQWVEELQQGQLEVDLAIDVIAAKLMDARRNEAAFEEKFTARIDGLAQRLQATEKRIEDLSIGTRAMAMVDRVFAAARLSSLPPLALVFSVADQLTWGVFGHFIRRPGSQVKLSEELLQGVRDALQALLVERLGKSAIAYVDTRALVGQLTEVESTERAVIGYLARSDDVEVTPFHVLISERIGSGAWPTSLPTMTTVGRIAERVLSESLWAAVERKREKTDE